MSRRIILSLLVLGSLLTKRARQKKTVSFTLAMGHLSLIGCDMKRIVELGTFVVAVGSARLLIIGGHTVSWQS